MRRGYAALLCMPLQTSCRSLFKRPTHRSSSSGVEYHILIDILAKNIRRHILSIKEVKPAIRIKCFWLTKTSRLPRGAVLKCNMASRSLAFL